MNAILKFISFGVISVFKRMVYTLANVFGLQIDVINCFNVGDSVALGDTILVGMVCQQIKKAYTNVCINVITRNADLLTGSNWIDSLNNGKRPFYTIKFRYSFPISPTQHLLKDFFRKYGLPFIYQPQINISRNEKESVHKLIKNFDKPIISISAHSPRPAKLWPKEKWQRLVAMLLKDFTIIQLGNNSEPELTGTIRFAGKMSEIESIAIQSFSLLFVGLDSFLMHTARGLNIPSVIILGGRLTPQNIGYDENCNLYVKEECSPCGKQKICEYNTKCMDAISVETVWYEVKQLYNKLEKQICI